MKKIAVLGSTGSIGTQTLEIVRANGDIRVESVAAGSNIDLLEKQIREFHPRVAAVWNEEKAKELSVRVADTRTRVLSGKEGIIAAATVEKADTVVTGHRTGEQGDTGLRRAYHHAAGEGTRCPHSSGGFRTLRDLPESSGKQKEPHREDPADGFRRSLP